MKLLRTLPGLCVAVLLASTLNSAAQAQTNVIPDQIGGPPLSVWMAPATMTVGQTAQVYWASDYGTVVHIECVANPGGFVFAGADGPPSGSPTIGPKSAHLLGHGGAQRPGVRNVVQSTTCRRWPSFRA